MTSLAEMPEEVILAITLQTFHNSLPALARVSHSFYRCATPQIYRCVHFVETKEQGADWAYRQARFPDWSSPYHQSIAAFGGPPRQDSRIFRLNLLLRTISASKFLRSQILAASFQWQSLDSSGIERTIYSVIDLLEPSLKLLHLSRYLCAWYAHGLIYAGIPHITSLNIDTTDDMRYWGSGLGANVDRNSLYSIMTRPSLDSLSFVGTRSWDRSVNAGANQRSRTSNISCLSFQGNVPTGDVLQEILTWPKALRSFHYEAWRDRDERNHVHGLSSCSLVKALLSQRESLEELFITGESDPHAILMSGLWNFGAFIRLRRLGLPRDFMVITETSRLLWGLQSGGYGMGVEASLPPALEELQIEVSSEFLWGKYFGAKRMQHKIEDVAELSAWLCRIAQDKPSRYPSLTKLVLWQVCPAELEDKPHYCSLGEVHGCNEVLSVFKMANILIYWVVYSEPPLFGA